MSRKKDEDNSSKLGWGILGAAVTAGVAAAAIYGVKKLSDYIDEKDKEEKEKKAEKPKWEDEWYNRPVNEEAEGFNSASASSRPSASAPKTKKIEQMVRDPNLSLQDKLQTYYNGYVNVTIGDLDRPKQVLSDIKKVLLSFFQNKHPNLITELIDCGSSTEGLKVIKPDEFDVMIPIMIAPHAFKLKSDDRVPGYYVVEKKANSGMYTTFDEFLALDNDMNVTQYLSPAKIRSKFQSYISRAINNITNYDVRLGVKGPSIKITVIYDGSEKFDVDFVPVIKFYEQQIVAKPHPEVYKQNSTYEKYWRESFSHREMQIISRLPTTSCHKKCLKIAKAVRLNNPQLGLFSSYIFKTVMLNMIDSEYEELLPEEWNDDALQERFIDFCNQLHQHLMKGNLPHHFLLGFNLLDEFSDVAIENAKNFLAAVIRKNKVADLLKTNY